MKEYQVQYFELPVLVPTSALPSAAFGVAVARLTLDTSPGVPIEDAIAEVVESSPWFERGYTAVVGRVRYIEPEIEDREFALGLKGHTFGLSSTIAFPRVP